MTTKHAPTPWKVTKPDHLGLVAVDAANGDRIAAQVMPEEARRIVACVNACEGLNIEALKKGSLRSLIAGLEQYERWQRLVWKEAPEYRYGVGSFRDWLVPSVRCMVLALAKLKEPKP